MKSIIKFLFFLCMLVSVVKAQTFTPQIGNLAVLKVGDGVTTLGVTSTPVSIVQLTTSGTRVDSVVVPSTGTNKLVLLGNSYLDGSLRLSTNRQYITFAGYDAVAGSTSSATLDNTSKVIARIGTNGVVDLSTKIIQSGTGVKIGSVISDDGSKFWFSNANTNGTTTYPIGYTTFGTVSVPVAVSDARSNWRSVNIFGGQLLANISNGLLSIGTNLSDVTNPTNPLTAATLFTNNSSPSPVFSGYGFILFDLDPTEPGYDVAYELSQGSNTTRGLVKSIKTSGVWNTGATLTNVDVRLVANAPATNPGGLVDITGTLVSGKPMLYVTRGTGANNSILSISDAGGYSATFTPTYATVANAGENYSFIGISFTPGSTPNLVPLRLLSFNAFLVNETVVLKWHTTSEIKTKVFEVERSTDGTKFTTIGQIAANNTVLTNDYNYSDGVKIEGFVFYRLKMIDIDGSFRYSSVISINNKLSTNKLSVYPNPFTDNVTITHKKSGRNDMISVLSVDGKRINSYRIEPNANQTTINLGELTKSQYLLEYTGKDGSSTILINKK